MEVALLERYVCDHIELGRETFDCVSLVSYDVVYLRMQECS
jgi:hypothetical protein